MPIFLNLVILVATQFIARALAPKPPQPQPSKISDFDIPTAEEGRPIPLVFGTVLIRGPNVTWFGDLKSDAITQSGGKK